MHLHKYPIISTNEHRSYEFVSEGPKGSIKKVINFDEMGYNFYNLSFGDWTGDVRKLDDKARSNNNDRDKVIATVASAVVIFFEFYPNATIFAKGSTPVRTRLYQMGIFANLREISLLLNIQGFIDGDWHPIERHIKYEAFMARIK